MLQGGRDPAAGVARADSTASSSGPPQLPATAASGSDDPSAAALAAWLQLAVVARVRPSPKWAMCAHL